MTPHTYVFISSNWSWRLTRTSRISLEFCESGMRVLWSSILSYRINTSQYALMSTARMRFTFSDIFEISWWFWRFAGMLLLLIAERYCCLVLRSHESPFSLQSCLGTLISFSEIISASVDVLSIGQPHCVFPRCCKLNTDNLLSRSGHSPPLNVPVICELMSKTDPSQWPFIWSRRNDIGLMPLLTLRINDGVTSLAIGCLVFITLSTCVTKDFFFFIDIHCFSQSFTGSLVEYLIRDCDSGSPRSPRRTVCFGS